MTDRFRKLAEDLLSLADVRTDGSRPWDLRVHDERLFSRVFRHGSRGLGEAYMDGWWECDRLDQLFERLLRAELERRIGRWLLVRAGLRARLLNFQHPSRAFHIGRHHYDTGNDLYRRMLDSRMIYSCGYWNEAKTLDEAQEAKLDLVCRKLRLEPGMKVLDIGCGWGGAIAFAAERYGVEGVGITVSEEQIRYAREAHAELPVSYHYQDYRSLEGRFDRIFSLGMFEHVGYKNYRTFFEVARRSLADDGLLLLHTIAGNRSTTRTDPWIQKYIFPNSMLPSARQTTGAYEGLFVLEDWHSFGADYDPTLMSWHGNFENAWPELESRYGEPFRRMWRYYLLSCAGSFRARKNQLWQIVLSPGGVPGSYRAPR